MNMNGYDMNMHVYNEVTCSLESIQLNIDKVWKGIQCS